MPSSIISTSLSRVSLLLVARRTLSHVMVHIVSRVALGISDKVRSISVGVSSDVLIMSMKMRGDWSRYVAQLADVSVTSSSRYDRSGSRVPLGLWDMLSEALFLTPGMYIILNLQQWVFSFRLRRRICGTVSGCQCNVIL